MATKFTAAAVAELACGVCFQFFVKPHEPKNLPNCPHIMCLICMQKMTEGGLKSVKCPQCNTISRLTKKGVDGLTTSLALRNLAERHPEGIKQYKEYLQSQLKCGKEKTVKKVTKLKELIQKTRQAIWVEEQEIEKTVEAVMKKAQELIKQLKSTSGLDQLQDKLFKLESEMKQTETSESKLETMTDEEFHAKTDEITNQIEKLKNHDKEITSYPYVGTFIANIQLGRIVKPRHLELVQEFGEFEQACGIASNSNGVLAVCDYHLKQISVFLKNSTEYKQHMKFLVHKMTPTDVSLSEEGKYFVTKSAAEFAVYSADGKFEKTESVIQVQSGKWNMDVTSGSICSTKDGRILIGSRVQAAGKDLEEYVVTVHDKEGSFMKTIPTGIIPLRIADIKGTHVAICNWLDDKVCVYDMQTGKETLSIDVQIPHGICHDEQSDCLLISIMTEKDENGYPVDGSGVIEQYCRISGELVARLAHGLCRPYGLTITEDNMLALVDRKTVKLYKMD